MSTFLSLSRLELRRDDVALLPLQIEHAPALAVAAAESRMTYDFTPVPNGFAESHSYIETALRQKQSGQRYPFVIEWGGRVVGTTSFYDYQPWRWPLNSGRIDSEVPGSVEIGYTWLAASAQRTACNTQSKFLLLVHAFDKWQVQSVAVRTDERNHRSRRAIERLGFQFEGIRRAHMPGSDGTVRNSAYYSVISAEWAGVREHVLALLRRNMG